jgi:hypothetical protein
MIWVNNRIFYFILTIIWKFLILLILNCWLTLQIILIILLNNNLLYFIFFVVIIILFLIVLLIFFLSSFFLVIVHVLLNYHGFICLAAHFWKNVKKGYVFIFIWFLFYAFLRIYYLFLTYCYLDVLLT